MPKLTSAALLLAAVFASSPVASAQNTYKCGNSYSQFPCLGATVLQPRDERDSSQKNQADTATQRDALNAEALEKKRLQHEQKNFRSNTPRNPAGKVKPTHAHELSTTQDSRPLKKKLQPAYFTAKVPDEKLNSKSRKKKTSEK